MLVYAAIIAGLTAYLLGNLNGAVCVSAIIAHDDVRSHGSGNAGLTNFIRHYGAGKALYVILIDGGKAIISCLNGGLMLEAFGYRLEGMILGGVCVILGHAFPALLGFRGGKGILSGFAVALAIDWRIAAIILAVFALAYVTTGYVSLGSVLGAVMFAVGFAVFHHDNVTVMVGGIFIGVLAVLLHHGNILRLIKGQERKTNLFKKKAE